MNPRAVKQKISNTFIALLRWRDLAQATWGRT
jgi:hypothetical protein